MKPFFLCITFLFSTLAHADLAPLEPTEEPSEESSEEEIDSGEAEKEETSGCNSVSPIHAGTLLLPVLCLGGAILLRKEERAMNEQ